MELDRKLDVYFREREPAGTKFKNSQKTVKNQELLKKTPANKMEKTKTVPKKPGVWKILFG